MRRTGSGMSKCVSDMSSRVRVARSCIQSRKFSLPVIRRRGVRLERGDRLVEGAARHDLVGHPSHLVLDAPELVEGPGVGLLEVDRRAEEVARAQGVRLAANGVLVPASGGELRLETSGRRRRPRHSPPARAGRGWRAARATSDLAARSTKKLPPVALLAGPVPHLRGDRAELALRRHVAVVGLLGQRRAVPVQGRGDRCETGVDVRPRLLAVRGHQVEDRAHLVQPAGQDRDLGLGNVRLARISTSSPSRSRNASWAICSRSSTGWAAWPRPAPAVRSARAA